MTKIRTQLVSMSGRSKRNAFRGAAVAASIAVLAGFGIAPASAADIAIVSVGASSSVAGYTTYSYMGKNMALSVTSNWTNKTATSATLASIQICSGNTSGNGAAWTYPQLYRQNGSQIGYVHKTIPSGGCQTWAIGTNYSKQADGELVRVLAHVSIGTGQYLQTVSFKR